MNNVEIIAVVIVVAVCLGSLYAFITFMENRNKKKQQDQAMDVVRLMSQQTAKPNNSKPSWDGELLAAAITVLAGASVEFSQGPVKFEIKTDLGNFTIENTGEFKISANVATDPVEHIKKCADQMTDLTGKE